MAFNGLDPNNANLYCLPDTINVIVMNSHSSNKLFLVAALKYEIKSKKRHLVEIRILGPEEGETETFEKAKQIIHEEKTLSYCDGS